MKKLTLIVTTAAFALSACSYAKPDGQPVKSHEPARVAAVAGCSVLRCFVVLQGKVGSFGNDYNIDPETKTRRDVAQITVGGVTYSGWVGGVVGGGSKIIVFLDDNTSRFEQIKPLLGKEAIVETFNPSTS